MLIPRKQKFRKAFRGKLRGLAATKLNLSFGQFGLKATTHGRLTSRQIEAARRAMTRYIKREGQIWIRIFPDKPVTAQPAETGMGGGKGAVDHFEAPVRAGTIIFEMGGVEQKIAQEAMRLAASKLPIQSKFTAKES